jgi:hypothetical protein
VQGLASGEDAWTEGGGGGDGERRQRKIVVELAAHTNSCRLVAETRAGRPPGCRAGEVVTPRIEATSHHGDGGLPSRGRTWQEEGPYLARATELRRRREERGRRRMGRERGRRRKGRKELWASASPLHRELRRLPRREGGIAQGGRRSERSRTAGLPAHHGVHNVFFPINWCVRRVWRWVWVGWVTKELRFWKKRSPNCD